MTALGAAGQQLYDAITGEYTLRTDELLVLTSAARMADRIEVLEAEIESGPLWTDGPGGRQVPNPMLTEVRHCHLALASLLGKLGLGMDEDEAASARSASASARALNSHRWRGKGAA